MAHTLAHSLSRRQETPERTRLSTETEVKKSRKQSLEPATNCVDKTQASEQLHRIRLVEGDKSLKYEFKPISYTKTNPKIEPLRVGPPEDQTERNSSPTSAGDKSQDGSHQYEGDKSFRCDASLTSHTASASARVKWHKHTVTAFCTTKAGDVWSRLAAPEERSHPKGTYSSPSSHPGVELVPHSGQQAPAELRKSEPGSLPHLRDRTPEQQPMSKQGAHVHFFAGQRRPLSYSFYIRSLGGTAIDYDIEYDPNHDIRGGLFQELLLRIRNDEIESLLIDPPCRSAAVLKCGAPNQVRFWPEYPDGNLDLPEWRAYIQKENQIWDRSLQLVLAMHKQGKKWIIENPPPRRDPEARCNQGHHFRPEWASHASFWDYSGTKSLLWLTQAKVIELPQGPFGSPFEKWTILACSRGHLPRISILNSFEQLRQGAHEKMATGKMAKEAAQFPPALCLALARAQTGSGPAGLLDPHPWEDASGSLPSEWPETLDIQSHETKQELRAELKHISRRRAEPENEEVLSEKPIPTPNKLPSTSATGPVRKKRGWPPSAPPPPLKIEQFFLKNELSSEVLPWIEVEAASIRTLAKGTYTNSGRPMIITHPKWVCADGCSWNSDDPNDVRPIWPDAVEAPPEQETRRKFFRNWAKTLGCKDNDLLHQMANGVEGRSQLPPNKSVFNGHHKGLREHFEPAAESIQTDTERGWMRPGAPHPVRIPCILTPKNCVEKLKWKVDEETKEVTEVVKWRVTTDDSWSTTDSRTKEVFPSRNECMPREDWPGYMLPGPRTLGECVAIIKAISKRLGLAIRSELHFEQVALWALDLSDAYRALAVARHEQWQQCFIWWDGVRVDLRCVFGSAHMVGLFERVSTFVLLVASHRIDQYDKAHPYSPAREEWLRERKARLGPQERARSLMCYIDDILASFVKHKDEKWASGPLEWCLTEERVKNPPRTFCRGDVHMAITRATFEEAGWKSAIPKMQSGLMIAGLGFAISTEKDGFIGCPEDKRQGLIVECERLQTDNIKRSVLDAEASRTRNGKRARETDHEPEKKRRRKRPSEAAPPAPREWVERLTGRLSHIAAAAQEGNAYLNPLHRMCNASARTSNRRQKFQRTLSRLPVSGGGQTQQKFQEALRWWSAALQRGIQVPLYPRENFPMPSEPGCAVLFTDAARSYHTGFGGFSTEIHPNGVKVMPMLEGAWPSKYLEMLRTNEISMPAGELFGLACLAVALTEFAPGSITHMICFTDSTGAKSAINSGGSGAPQLDAIVEWLHSKIGKIQILAIHQPGKRNRAADFISRGRKSVIRREAEQSGFTVLDLPWPQGSLDLLHLVASFPVKK